ncbi:L(+)-tartrate dehydratase subunit alpha [subsurface metagenome]
MITKDVFEEVIFNTIKKSSCCIPQDVYNAFKNEEKIAKTTKSRMACNNLLRSTELSVKRGNPACPDTGWPLFFYKIGNEAVIEGGILELEKISIKMVAKATGEGFLRSTMKHPLTGQDPGNNIGLNIPYFDYKFVPGNSIEITYVAKGGGSECFGGTRFRMIAFADGIKGIEKFIVDSYIAATRAGAICPPGILGIGIGGTANIAANIAKEAACLRIVGSHHPESMIMDIEKDLYCTLNNLNIGIMGSGEGASVLSVNIEYAYTHIAGIAVALSSNCCISRRATTKIYDDGKIEELDDPNWFDRE